VDAALRGVSSDQRVAWMLHVVEGWSLPEVAEACDCSLATVKRRIRAARESIEVLFDPSELRPSWTPEVPS
jgi:RNA polymerase sigma-70 factor, ECF subfamily